MFWGELLSLTQDNIYAWVKIHILYITPTPVCSGIIYCFIKTETQARVEEPNLPVNNDEDRLLAYDVNIIHYNFKVVSTLYTDLNILLLLQVDQSAPGERINLFDNDQMFIEKLSLRTRRILLVK